MRRSVVVLAVFLICHLLAAQNSLDNDGVIKLVKAGLSDDLIITTINSKSGSFDTSTDGLIALKTAGVSDKVVSVILGKLAPSAKPVASAAASAASAGTKLTGEEAPTANTTQDAPANSSTDAGGSEDGTAKGSGKISSGARIVIAPMGGFETYFAAAVREKKVPVTLTLDKKSAQFFVVSTQTEWQGFVYGAGGGANWNRMGGNASYGAAASSTRGLEASIMLIDAKTKDVVWAYEVHKNSHGALIFGTHAARGQQSLAEACAKHLREYIEKGK